MTELEFERQLIEQLSSGIISSTANQMGRHYRSIR